MEKQIDALQMKISNLESQLDKTKKRTSKKGDNFKSEIEQEYPNRFTLERDPDENARIIEIVKEMDEENKEKMRLRREQLEKEREKEAKYVALQKAKAEAAAEAKAKAEAEKKAAAEAKAAQEAEVEKMIARKVKNTQTDAEKGRTKSVKKGAETKKATPAPKNSNKKTKSSGKAKTKSVTKKSAKSVSGRTPVSDWQKLSEATIKRKTVAELTSYLTEKVRINIILPSTISFFE